MDLKKSLFGGYNKASVDAVFKQMQEIEEQAQAKIALLENEYRLSKENVQKNMESIQTESMIRQKSLVELTRTLEEKNSRLAELEAKEEKVSTDVEEQLRTLVSELEAKYSTRNALLEKSHAATISSLEESNSTKTAFLENKYNAKIAELEERYQRDIGAMRQNDEQVKRIGQLYVDAQEYTEKMKQESKAKNMESVDQIFEQIFMAQEQYEASIKEISLKNQNIKQIAAEMQETIQTLQSKVETMEREQGNIVSPFENIKAVKERIKHQIHSQYEKENEKHAAEPIKKHNEPDEKTVHEEKTIVQVPVKPQEMPIPAFDYAQQLAELKQRIERQEELLSMQSMKVTAAMESIGSIDPVRNIEPVSEIVKHTMTETSFPDFHIEEEKPVQKDQEPIVEYAGASESDTATLSVSEESTIPPVIPGYEAESVSETEEESDEPGEKELFDRDSYSKYFAEIGKKFGKEQPVSNHMTAPAENPSVISSPEEPENFEEKKETVHETENTLPKKPSIKDILNKYANLK
jgi:hypothetical protein